jgi:hypothetical protein
MRELLVKGKMRIVVETEENILIESLAVISLLPLRYPLNENLIRSG